jgi:hypothetical protein
MSEPTSGIASLILAPVAVSLLSQTLLQHRPAQGRLPQELLGIGGKGVPVLLAAEQIKPLSRDQPKPRVTGDDDAAGQIDRVVTAELGAVNIGMGDKRRAIALVAETPDGAGLGSLEVLQAYFRTGVDKIGDGVVTLDGETREAVQDHPLGGGPLGRAPGNAQCGKAGQQNDQGYSGARAVSFLPLCRHS